MKAQNVDLHKTNLYDIKSSTLPKEVSVARWIDLCFKDEFYLIHFQVENLKLLKITLKSQKHSYLFPR